MARKPSRRDQLLNEAIKRERAATRKINRIQHNTGAKIKGTEFDPRTNDVNLLRTMNGRELRSHINKVNRFVDRGTQFVGGTGGAPLPRNRWDAYESLQEKFNEKATPLDQRFGGLQLAGQSGTVGSRDVLMQPSNVRLANSTFRTFQPVNREPNMVTNAKSLEKLIKSMRDKNTKGYMEKSLQSRLGSAKALLRGSQLEDFIVQITGGTTRDEAGNEIVIAPMSLDELDLLLNHSRFSDIAADRFGSGTDEVAARDERDRDYELRNGTSHAADIRAEMQRELEWVRTSLAPADEEPTPAPTPSPTRQSRGGKRK